MSVTRLRQLKLDRGVVTVMLALWLPLIGLMATFGVDVGHWFDYRRNLQTRADAAALAAGLEYGGTCSNPAPALLANIGHVAQYYTGAAPAKSDMAYPGLAGTYYNPPNLTKGSLSDFHVVLNGANYWTPGGTAQSQSFTMSPPAPSTFCDSTDENGRGPLVDVKLTQSDLGLFFPFPFSKVAAISAHARVEIKPQSGGNVSAIAVRDAAQTPCLYAYFVDNASGTTLATAILHKETPTGDEPVTWDNGPGGTPVPISNSSQVSVEAFPNDCETPPDGNLYDGVVDATGPHPNSGIGKGIVYINTFNDTTPPTPTNLGPPIVPGGNPKLIGGGTPTQAVTLTTTDCPAGAGSTAVLDPYFTNNTATCHVSVHVNAAFNQYPGPGTCSSNGIPHNLITVTDLSPAGDPAKTVCVDTAGAVDVGPFAIAVGDPDNPLNSRHEFKIDWEQQVGYTVKGGTSQCTKTGSNPCKGTFGVQQATFAAFEDGSAPNADDSGEFIQAQIGQSVGGVIQYGSLFNSVQRNTTPNLVVTFKLGGLHNSKPTDPPIVLRFPVNNSTNNTLSKRTGVIDCGQDVNGANQTYDAILNGCPDALQIYSGPPCVAPPSAPPINCVEPIPGNKRQQVANAVEARVGTGCDWWQAVKAAAIPNGPRAAFNFAIPPGDSRALTMIVTRIADLSGKNNGPPIPILGFTTFYVTGFDGDKWLPSGGGGGQKIPGCDPTTANTTKYANLGDKTVHDYLVSQGFTDAEANNVLVNKDEDPPAGTNEKFAVWGHFIKYTVSGSGGPGFCDPTAFGNCVAVLTR
jgi:Putative Flp pilus-assembly TadE/G-like